MAMCQQSVRGILHSVLVILGVAALAAAACGATSTLVLRSGSVPDQDEQVWVRGSASVRASLQSSGLPLQHPYIVDTPSYWGEVGGGVFWLSPSPDTSAAPGGYEYYTEFTLPDDVATATLDVMWRGDDWAALAINGRRLPGIGFAPPTAFPSILHTDLAPFVQKGVNQMSFFIENAFTTRNPTGLAFLASITHTRQSASGSAQPNTITLQSGGVDRDSDVWVRGSGEVQPGIPNSGLSLQHPFIVNTPGYWGDLGGVAHWVCPWSDSSGVNGGYEYYVDFTLPDTWRTATLDLRWRGDNYAIPAVNGNRLPGSGSIRPNDSPTGLHTSITQFARSGANRLSFFVENAPSGFSPTGVIFEAIITYTH
jgi:hypothetical protein